MAEQQSIFQRLPTLETERLILREIVMNDAEAIFQYANDEHVARFVTWPAHRTVEESRAFVAFVEGRRRTGGAHSWGLALKETGPIVGTCGFVGFDANGRTGKLGYAIKRSLWGRGLATEAAREVLVFAWKQLHLSRVDADVDADNGASKRVLEKLGFENKGLIHRGVEINNRVRDVELYSLYADVGGG